MRVAVVGHTGMTGRALTEILLARGHQVTGISAHADRAPRQDGVCPVQCDIWDAPRLVNALAGHDVAVSAFSGGHLADERVFYRQADGTRRIIKAFRQAGDGYLIYVGGAASLFVKPGVQMCDDERFPRWYYGALSAAHLRWLGELTGKSFFTEAARRRISGLVPPGESDPKVEDLVKDWTRVPLLEGCRLALELFEGRTDFAWSFLSPPWCYRPGPGTGRYELGVDFMIFNNGLPAGIDVPDLALAIADEVENRALVHKHWTVAGQQDDT